MTPLLFQNVLAGLYLQVSVHPPQAGHRVILGIDARDQRCHWILRKAPGLACGFHVSPLHAPELCLGLLHVEDVPAGNDYRQIAFCALVHESAPSADWIVSHETGIYKLTNAVQYQFRPGDLPPFHVADDGYTYPLFPQFLSMHMDFMGGIVSDASQRSLQYPIPLPGHPVCCIPLGMSRHSEWRIFEPPCAEIRSAAAEWLNAV